MLKKSVSLFVSLLMIVGVFSLTAATASAKGIEKKAKLKLYVPDAEVSYAKKIAKSFIKKYKKKKIKIKIKAQSEPDAGTMLLADGESAADVAAVSSDQILNLVRAKVISPVKKSSAIKKSELKNSVSAFTVKKKLYASPRSCQSYCLVYDKSVVSEENSKTLEGVLEACKENEKKFIMDAENGYYSCIFLFTGGLRLTGLEKDGYTQKFNKYDADTVAETMKAFSILFHKYKGVFDNKSVSWIPSGFTQTSNRKSTCAAGIDGIWDYAACKAALGEKFGAAKLPTINVNGKDRQMVNMFNYTGYVVNKYTKYPKASQALMKYLGKKSSQKKRISYIMPTNKALLNSKHLKNPMMKALYQQEKYSVAQASTGTIWDPFGNLGSKLVSKKTNPETYDFKKLLKNTINTVLDR